jgi:hypothetical protein
MDCSWRSWRKTAAITAEKAGIRQEFATKAQRAQRRIGGLKKKGERRPDTHKRLLYCVNVNRTSLDHLLLGESADVDRMSSEVIIARVGDVRTSGLIVRLLMLWW